MVFRRAHYITLLLILAAAPLSAVPSLASTAPDRCAAALLAPVPTKPWEVRIAAADFRQLFYDILTEVTVTSQRKEDKVVTSLDETSGFLATVRAVLGDDQPGATARLIDRDPPAGTGLRTVTNTDYLAAVRGLDDAGTRVHSAVIRIRNYLFVPEGAQVSDLAADAGTSRTQPALKLADGAGLYVKLEFKVGYSEEDATGKRVDVQGVVNKPDVVIDRADLDLLLKSPESYANHRAAVAARAKALILTRRDGSIRIVNSAPVVEAMIDRIGLAHQTGALSLEPVVNIRYIRKARRVRFADPFRPGETFEVQITVDEQARVKSIETGQIFNYAPDERIIELKVPTRFSSLSDAALVELGLSELAAIRSAYFALPEAVGTVRGQGKRSRGRQGLGV